MSKNDSLTFKERLSISGNDILSNSHLSGKMIGEVTINGYDELGNQLFSETEYNDIVLSGSTFVLGEMFKPNTFENIFKMSKVSDFPIPSGYVDNDSVITLPGTIEDPNFKSMEIFGFVVGNGGEDGTSVIAPSYNVKDLLNKQGELSYLPFRITDDDTVSKDYELVRLLKEGENEKTAYYVKKFDVQDDAGNTIIIKSETSDGTEITSSSIATNVPIVTYAEIGMTISEKDVREFFGANLEDCYINQIGLVAGVKDSSGSHSDLVLVTNLNFKAKDLSNNANKIKFIYRVYCL